jgi:hypothetical protein
VTIVAKEKSEVQVVRQRHIYVKMRIKELREELERLSAENKKFREQRGSAREQKST